MFICSFPLNPGTSMSTFSFSVVKQKTTYHASLTKKEIIYATFFFVKDQ